MGLWRSPGYNAALNARSRRVRDAQDEEYEAIPASELRAGDRVLLLEYPAADLALAFRVLGVKRSARGLPGLGLFRFGAATSKLVEVSAELDTRETEKMDPATLWVLKLRASAQPNATQ
jgi:hypothetical protein